MKKKVIVTGGSGFIGSRYIAISNENQQNKILDKRKSDKFASLWSNCDICKQELLNSCLPDTDLVIHLAAEHRDDVHPVSRYYDVNVEGTKNVLEAMDKNGVSSIVFTSSVAIFGLNKKNPNEDHPADPFNDYGKSKWQAEELLRKWYYKKPDERNLTIIRPTVVFGEDNRGNVYNLLKQIASGKFMMVGSGRNNKSMAYVGNIAAFIDFCSNNMKGYQVYNYIDKPDLNMNELVKQVGLSLDYKIPSTRLPKWLGMLGGYGFDLLSLVTRKPYSVSSVRVKKFCATTQFDSSKAINSGFKAPFTLSEGLDRTLKHEFLKKD